MSYLSRSPRLTLLIPVIAVLVACGKDTEPTPLFSQDMHPFGFLTETGGNIIGSFTDIDFLSDDLILVTVNNRVYGPVERSFSDQPPSKLILFDVSRRAVVRTAEMRVEKRAGSVKATRGGQFVLLNESGLHLCTPELQCGSPVDTLGPLWVSPQGTRIIVGGNRRTDQKLLDASSLQELGRFPAMAPAVIPGDSGLLIRYGVQMYVRLPDKPDQPVNFDGRGVWPEARFLNDSTIADFETDKELAVAKTDGGILFRVPVSARWHVAQIVAAAGGSRFCFHEAGYTTLNSIVNFYDIDNGRPLNFETVKVMPTNSARALFQLRWDPRPYVGLLSPPALSPDGHRLAVIRHGFLQVYEVP